jgi:hypothetical protein
MRNVSPSLSPRLPTLKGEFGLFLRIYQPKAEFGTGECASAPRVSLLLLVGGS